MQSNILEQFIKEFNQVISKLTLNKTYSSIIFLCIGTDRIIGDSFGPIVGYKLKKKFQDVNNAIVIGDLENIVCSLNIEEVINRICKTYSNPFIISIDSALSKNKDDIGKVITGKGGIVVGSGLGKNRYYIGDMYIKGIIAQDTLNLRHNLRIIQNLRLYKIVTMAEIVANGIYNAIEIIK